jgi:hypothetical protein
VDHPIPFAAQPCSEGLYAEDVFEGADLASIVSDAECGTVLLVHAGVYPGNLRLMTPCSAESPILLISADGQGEAVLTGTDITRSVIEAGQEASYFGVYGFEINIPQTIGDAGGYKSYGAPTTW